MSDQANPLVKQLANHLDREIAKCSKVFNHNILLLSQGNTAKIHYGGEDKYLTEKLITIPAPTQTKFFDFVMEHVCQEVPELNRETHNEEPNLTVGVTLRNCEYIGNSTYSVVIGALLLDDEVHSIEDDEVDVDDEEPETLKQQLSTALSRMVADCPRVLGVQTLLVREGDVARLRYDDKDYYLPENQLIFKAKDPEEFFGRVADHVSSQVPVIDNEIHVDQDPYLVVGLSIRDCQILGEDEGLSIYKTEVGVVILDDKE